MMKCFFNTCPLNEETSLKAYQRAHPEIKVLFSQVDPNDDIIKSSKLISSYKRYSFCLEHLASLKKYHHFKTDIEKLISSSPLNTSELRSLLKTLNMLIRYDDNMKGISLKMDTIELVSFILSRLNQHDRTIDMLLLLNLSHYLKEITYAKKYATNDLYLAISNYFLSYSYTPYEHHNQFTNSEREMMLRDSIIYELCLENLRFILLNAKEKGLAIDITAKVTMKVMEMLTMIIIYDKTGTIPKANNDYCLHISIVEKKTMISLSNFIYSLLICRNSQIELNSCIVLNICKYAKEMYRSIMGINDHSLTLTYVILLNEIMTVIMRIKSEELDEDHVEMFMTESEAFINLQQLQVDSVIEIKIKGSIALIREKMKIAKIRRLNRTDEIVQGVKPNEEKTSG